MGRVREIDGIRGWASLVVLLFHLFWEMFGQVVPGFHNTVTGFLLDGYLAVSIFFVLSGEALSASYFAGKGSVARLAIRRYPRLVVPIFASCLVVMALSVSDLVFNAPASDIVQGQYWLGLLFLIPPPTLLETAKYSMFQVFTLNAGDPLALSAFLWTMKFELIGSMLVFLALFLFRYIRSAYGVLAIASFALLLLPLPSRNLACFFVGMIFAKMRADGWWDRIQGHRFSASSWLLILPVAFIDGISNRNFAGQGNKPLYAMILIAAVFANKPLCGFFSSGLSQFLGKVSFPLYLLQFPVLISLTSWMILSLSTDGHLSVEAVWLIAAVTVAVCLLASVMFWPIEKLTKWTEDAVTKLVFSSWDRLAAIIAQGKYQ